MIFLNSLSKAPHSCEPAIALDLSLVIEKYPNLTSASIPNEGCGASFRRVGASFSSYFVCLGGFWLPSLGRCFGRLLGGSWSRLGAVLGPKMDPVTSKLPFKPNPIGIVGRLEASLERPRSVLGAS